MDCHRVNLSASLGTGGRVIGTGGRAHGWYRRATARFPRHRPYSIPTGIGGITDTDSLVTGFFTDAPTGKSGIIGTGART
jgi:hypothetical protein